MNLSQWLAYLETLNPDKIKLGLERVTEVAQNLQLNTFTCPVITVGGTNGKGSSVTFLEQIFLASHYRVGAYTSPHLFQFNERVHIQGRSVADTDLCNAFAVIQQASQGILLTYFEFTTLAALVIFQQAKLDVLILEVGLGGRLDAVNIIAADIALITNIALDHTEWLGNTREVIGYEKAGIMRTNKPVVCGETDVPLSVINYANELNANLYSLGKDYNYVIHTDSWDWSSKLLNINGLPVPQLPIQNAAAILMVLELLQSKLPLQPGAIAQGLKQARLPGRFQQILKPVLQIFDVAHNPAGGQWLARRLSKEVCVGKTYAVVGMLADKDIPGTLAPLLPYINGWYAGNLPTARSSESEEICKTLWELGVKECYTFSAITAAYSAALAKCSGQDRLLIFGSFYTVSTILEGIV